MERNFVKRDAKTKSLLTAEILSPVVADYIYENEVPKPCRFFCGRDRELETLHEELIVGGRVFIHGIADIDFSDDLLEESRDERFRRHNRFLRSLKEDPLMDAAVGYERH